MNIVGAKKKSSLKRNKAPKDPMAVAMSEMMQRIKSGNIQLKPVRIPSSGSSESDDTDAMSDLGNLLKTFKRNPSVDVGPGITSPGADNAPVEWVNIKLRKPSAIVETSKGTSSSGDTGNNNSELKKVVLRKPRSHSAGDILDERPKDEATAELKRILQRQKAAAEKENAEQNGKRVCETGAT